MENEETNIQGTAKKKYFPAYLIPNYSASLLRDSINKGFFKIDQETGKSPLHTVYNAHTGYPLNAKDLVPASIRLEMRNAKNEDKTIPIMFSKSFADTAHTQIKAGEKGLLYNFKDKNDQFQTAQYYFANQTQEPEKIVAAAYQKIEQNKAEAHMPESNELVITDKEDYMATLLLASKFANEVKIVCTPEIEQQALKTISAICENQMRKPELRETTIPPLNDFLYKQELKAQNTFKEMANKKTISFPNKETANEKIADEMTQSHKIEQAVER